MPMKVGDVELFSLPEAAQRLGLSHATLRWQVKNGRMIAQRLGGRWVVTAEEIERYDRENKGGHGNRFQKDDAE